MKETKQFIGTLYNAFMFLQEHVNMADEEGRQLWKLCSDNGKFPTSLYAGSLIELYVEKCVYEEEQSTVKAQKSPTKSQLIEQELIESLGEDQIGAAKIVEPPKQRRQRVVK